MRLQAVDDEVAEEEEEAPYVLSGDGSAQPWNTLGGLAHRASRASADGDGDDGNGDGGADEQEVAAPCARARASHASSFSCSTCTWSLPFSYLVTATSCAPQVAAMREAQDELKRSRLKRLGVVKFVEEVPCHMSASQHETQRGYSRAYYCCAAVYKHLCTHASRTHAHAYAHAHAHAHVHAHAHAHVHAHVHVDTRFSLCTWYMHVSIHAHAISRLYRG